MVLSRLKPQSEKKLTKQICKVVLDHFEKQYIKELGESWIAVRDILTSPTCWQYAVLLNRFNYPFQLEKDLQVKRYHTLFQGYFPYYPKSLMCYVSRIPERIPSDKYQIGKIKGYYLLNAASLLPVLALELQNGERVLDMCAAPGGKSIALLQCAYPGYFHCNEYDNLRSRWLKRTLESFIPQPMTNIIKVTELDGRQIGHIHPEMFDKILVDAPCSNDRSWLISSDTQIASYRLNQRKKLPIIQIKLLRLVFQLLQIYILLECLEEVAGILRRMQRNTHYTKIVVPEGQDHFHFFLWIFNTLAQFVAHKPSRYSGKTQNRTLKITNYHDYT
ncbi:tRNA (cytosine(34)-C(5))-methyltransferase, mitochondrial isoform X4 [Sarcophilus harrisii]|uniref:tRNA (cytosine(34)-C(5))-methyltransferase, mitochondrial isoform X4 n=1 Tax=Sarcophilus harrisii TaxID=9305 RepID=UPI000C7D0CA4|nr:tRNA (cytosine(34)-C(5))-methyltransferase, mitochondrial isoform X4 [Sarcophilus harrisii]